MVMNEESDPLPTPEDLATEQLAAAVESAIAVIQERLANLAPDGQDAKLSMSDLAKLLELRKQLRGERPPTISVRWIDDPIDIGISDNIGNNNDRPEPNTRAVTYIDAH